MSYRVALAALWGLGIDGGFAFTWWGLGEGHGLLWHAFGGLLTATAALGCGAVAYVMVMPQDKEV